MPKYLFLMLGLPAQPGAADAQTRAYYDKWGQYMNSLAGRGQLESAEPLEPSTKRVNSAKVADQELAVPDLYGFLVVNAASLDDAIAIAREAPHMALGGTTIVRPCLAVGR